MHRYGPHRTRTATPSRKTLLACFMLCVVAAASARAECGCPSDGHGLPKLAGVGAPSSWLSALIDWRLAAMRESGVPARPPARRQV